MHKGKIQENIWKKDFGAKHVLDVTGRDAVEEDNIMTTKHSYYDDFRQLICSRHTKSEIIL